MSSTIPVLEIKNHLPPGGFFYVGRQFYRGSHSCMVHTHRDFAEVSWVEQGSTEHRINGRRQILEKGDVVLFRERDTHGFFPAGDQGFTLTNIAFDLPVLESIRERYFADRVPWIWDPVERGGPQLPYTRRVDVWFLDWLRTRADALASERQTALQLDCFLMELLRQIDRETEDLGTKASEVPTWLAGAIAKMREVEHLREGVGALVRLTGRSREHVSRCVSQHTGQTATDLVNELRLDFAARELRMTQRPILEIAWDSGISSLAHFYRVFKVRFGVSPGKFRASGALTGR
jgi:AraC family cel operon transcriptional repressor